MKIYSDPTGTVAEFLGMHPKDVQQDWVKNGIAQSQMNNSKINNNFNYGEVTMEHSYKGLKFLLTSQMEESPIPWMPPKMKFKKISFLNS